MVWAMARAAHSLNRGDSPMAICGRSKMENQSPLKGAASHHLPCWPRAAVRCSAKTTRPSGQSPPAICSTTSLVEPVSSKTTISVPIVKVPMPARSFAALNRSRDDIDDFERKIDGTRRMRQGADRDVIDAGGGNDAD